MKIDVSIKVFNGMKQYIDSENMLLALVLWIAVLESL